MSSNRKLFGNSLGVSGLLILVASIVFGNLFGIIGVVLAIPVATILSLFTMSTCFRGRRSACRMVEKKSAAPGKTDLHYRKSETGVKTG